MPWRHLLLVASLLAIVGWPAGPTVAANAQMIAPEVKRLIIRGRLGETMIGMNLTLRGYDEVLAGHYYRGRDPTDIPLAIERRGDDIVMRDPEGGSFHLRLFGHADSGPPFDFSNSIMLIGIYLKGGERLRVQLTFESEVGDEPDRRWYGDVTDRSDAEFEDLARRFLEGAISGNREQAADAVSFPLRVSGSCTRFIRDRAQLRQHWAAIFSPDIIAQLNAAIPHEMFVHDGLAMVGHGELWFDSRGAVELRISGCPVRRARPPASGRRRRGG